MEAADEADRHGMVTRVVPRDELMTTTRAMARTLAELSPRALRDTRNLMYQMESMDFSRVPEVAADAISSAFDSADSLEARQAFLEKRAPVWQPLD